MLGLILSQNLELELEAEFLEQGIFDSAGIQNTLQQASRVNLRTLILDVDVAPADAILEGIHYFRVQRPETRIIVLAIGRESGDTTLAGIVSKGVYDILTPTEDMDVQEVIEKKLFSPPATYAQAARFVQDLEFEQNQRQKEIIYQSRPLGLTTIAVAGAGSGAGTSHIALAIASHIGKNGNKVLLAEYPTASEPPNPQQGKPSQYFFLKNEMKPKHFDILTTARSRNIAGIRHIFENAAGYDYMVLDLGELTPQKIDEMDRAALAVLVTSAAPTRFEYMIPILKEDDITFWVPNLKNWRIVVNLANSEYMRWFINAFGKYIHKIYAVGYFPDPIKDIPSEIIQEIVDPIMPIVAESPKKKNIFQKLLSKKGGKK